MIETFEPLTQQALCSRLTGHPWQTLVQVLDTVDSTNNAAKQLAAQGAPQGTAILAGHQTAGRGRRGRSFFSPPGAGLYLSVILRPQVPPDRLLHLTALCAVAAARAVEAACGLRPGLKWVNDLVVGRRKLGGILTELTLKPDGSLDHVVVGVGVNCCQTRFPADLADLATSIAAETGVADAKADLAASLLQELSTLEAALLPGPEKDAWLAEFAETCVTLGKDVQVLRSGSVRPARALGIDENAGLLVEYPDGIREVIASGEVSVRGMYGYV